MRPWYLIVSVVQTERGVSNTQLSHVRLYICIQSIVYHNTNVML